MKSPTNKTDRINSRLGGLWNKLARCLPQVRVFTGPESVRHNPRERRLLIHGRIVVIPKR